MEHWPGASGISSWSKNMHDSILDFRFLHCKCGSWTAGRTAAKKEFIPLHVITKNLQSIRSELRFEDLCTELVACDHDLIFVSETWRSAVEECFVLPSGGHIFLSGGLSHQGVGIAVSGKMMAHLSDISFHPYSPRLCLLKFKYCGLHFCSLSCYLSTSWDDDASVEGMRTEGDPIIMGGYFNSCIGGVQPGDSVDSLGSLGFDARNARGVQLGNWVLQNGFQIVSRQSDTQDIRECWTCERINFFFPAPFSRRCPWSGPPTRIRWQAYGSGQPGFASGHPPGVRGARGCHRRRWHHGRAVQAGWSPAPVVPRRQ